MDLLSKHLPFVHLDDEQFNLALFELNHGPVIFNQDRLAALFINPITVEERITSTPYLDPDLHFLTQADSKYFVPDQFNEVITQSSNNSALSLLHLNIRSINQNLSKLTDFLNSLDLDFKIIGISETWLDGNNTFSDHIDIAGFNFVHQSHVDRTGVGVGLFVNTDLNFKIRPDLSFFNVLIGTIYRPPNSNFRLFIDKMNEALARLAMNKKDCYIMGDFNIDLLKYQQHSNTNDFFNTMFSHSFLPVINRSTRITSHTAISIDKIFTNCYIQNNHSITNGLLFTDISDHLPIFSIIPQQGKTDDTPIKLTKRLITSESKKEIQQRIRKM